MLARRNFPMQVAGNPRLSLPLDSAWLLVSAANVSVPLSLAPQCPLLVSGEYCTLLTLQEPLRLCQAPDIINAEQLQSLAGCQVLIGPVILNKLSRNITSSQLSLSFANVSHIVGPLLVSANEHLVSLNFLRNLMVADNIELHENPS